MHRLPFPRLGRRILTALVTLPLAAAASLFGAAPAQAGVPFTWALYDGMDTSAANQTWTFERDGSGAGGFSSSSSRSAPRNGYLAKDGQGFSSVGRTVTPTWSYLHLRFCSVEVYVDPGSGANRINLELINPSTWSYISLREITVNPSQGYTRYSFGDWVNGPVSAFVRVSLLGNNGGPVAFARVDDLSVNCVYEPLPGS